MDFDTVPAWAHSACYYILAIVGIAAFFAIVQVVGVFMTTKSVGATAIVSLGTIISLAIYGFVGLIKSR